MALADLTMEMWSSASSSRKRNIVGDSDTNTFVRGIEMVEVLAGADGATLSHPQRTRRYARSAPVSLTIVRSTWVLLYSQLETPLISSTTRRTGK
eukprot:CAMPEP_0198321308 /NCGR_PEP_ID=MMETSP1450-20131203/10041_1 /TAXON_ID=753684 ORGANISM="Madagascaria erythrocladiodes, Strain CCMP3234" /NCGR_SAMPLE_ID=MMETSP1450 /ASSEMBLY_ACC=CAM_ASM_001115 /LENGTH=94 /DNA_ID=CAMNT_0044024849 /DNA_START=41 /DNA_END=325 /DNA_ORIENTATION=+